MSTDNDITPGRSTTLFLDLTEQVLIESAFSVTRAGAEIAKDVALGLANDTPDDPDARHANVTYWSSGAITLKPLQFDISNLHEGVVCATKIISTPANMTLVELAVAIPAIVSQDRFISATDLPGFAASSNIQPKGDPFLVKRIPAGQSYSNSLLDSNPTPEFVTQDIPMDRVGYSSDVFGENQGFFIRWTVPGSDVAVNGYTFCFYFGQYGLCLRGTGIAELWEYCLALLPGFPESAGAYQWKRRASWRYARAGQLANTAHSMAIWPHSDPSGRRYISFTNNALEQAITASQFERTGTAYVSPGEYLYNIDDVLRSPNDRDESPGYATKAAIIRYDLRRDLKVDVQFSTLGWPSSGFLIDLPADIPEFSDPNTPLYANAVVQSPPGCNIAATLLSAADNSSPYVIGQTPGPAARFDFTGNGDSTPILWKYLLARPAVTTIVTPGMFEVPVARVSVSGVSGDASQDTAEVLIHDPGAVFPRLRTRGRFSASLVTTDSAGSVVLHRGYALRPKSKRLGRAGRVYPDPDWRDITLPMAGMAQRLSEKYQGPQQRKYAADTSQELDNQGTPLPWRVTDVVYDLLKGCGYPDSQINIADQEIRLWPGETVKADDYVLDATGNYLEYIQRLVRDMLGAYLIYDANAGPIDVNGLPIGQWQILYQTPYPAAGGKFTPLFNFVTSAASATVPPHILSEYPSLTAPILGRVEYEIVPPEYNSVFVTTGLSAAGNAVQGAISSYCYNYESYLAPQSGVTPDPDSPDYLGYERRFIYPDMTLGAQATKEQTQAACDWVARRYYSFICHAQDLQFFMAPLVFITDPVGGYRRPLRFQDPISINGDAGYLVKACHPRYAKDGFQMAEYECINPNAGQYIPPGTESLSFHRAAVADHARHSTGSQTNTQKYSRRALPAHREHQHLELPNLMANRAPLQNPTNGSFYFMAGFSAIGGGDGIQ